MLRISPNCQFVLHAGQIMSSQLQPDIKLYRTDKLKSNHLPINISYMITPSDHQSQELV